MDSAEVLADAFGRIVEMVHGAVEGLSEKQLTFRVDEQSNPIVWLVWHLARVQDDHVAHVAGSEQIWTAAGWADRFGLDLPAADHGYGHTPQEVGLVHGDAEALLGYYDAVHEATLAYLRGLSDADLDRVVDDRWDPPVTLGARLVSVLNDDTAHAGQAAYVRGVIERR